ncbi:hypothetical protein [Streptomyces anulatus]|uniref:hypothetical protein n=1 Tax=Streptomyces anulatus TaxID=1892 RepID=UPI00366195E8
MGVQAVPVYTFVSAYAIVRTVIVAVPWPRRITAVAWPWTTVRMMPSYCPYGSEYARGSCWASARSRRARSGSYLYVSKTLAGQLSR